MTLIEICTCEVAVEVYGLGALPCSEPQVAVIDVPCKNATVELRVCAEHLRRLHDSRDPIEQARKWLP